MSIEFEIDSDVSSFLDWMLQSGVWDGRFVSGTEAAVYREKLQLWILKFLQDEGLFEQTAAQLARLGTASTQQSRLTREIAHLDFSKNDLILQAGWGKSLGKFWKQHKKEILIGAAVLAVVAVVVVVSVSTIGTGAGAAAAAGGAALEAASDSGSKKKPIKQSVSPPQEALSLFTMSSPVQECSIAPRKEEWLIQLPSLKLDSILTDNKLIFGQTGVLYDGQFSSYQDILCNQWKPSFPSSYEFSSFPLAKFDELEMLLPHTPVSV